MLFWRFSSSRTFFLNEYWILIPTMLFADYLIIRKIRSHKEKIKKLKQLKEKIERYKKLERLRRVSYLACGLSVGSIFLKTRGGNLIEIDGVNYVDVDYIDCGIENGLRYLDNDRLRKIIHNLFAKNKKKLKRKIIYITATAVCHIAQNYGKEFLALPIAVGDFGLTNLYQTIRKTFVTLLIGVAGPLYVVGTPISLFIAVTLGTMGLRLAYTDLDKLPTTFIDEIIPVCKIEPRIADLPDVVTVNFRNKITAPSIVQSKGECLLPEQAYFNANCNIKATEIPAAVNLAPPGLVYDEVVNMKDVTGLKYVDFTDIFDLGQTKPSPSIDEPMKGKTVNFLDKFGDPEDIDESDTWDTSSSSIADTVAKRMNLRTRNED